MAQNGWKVNRYNYSSLLEGSGIACLITILIAITLALVTTHAVTEEERSQYG
jgi:hypothetical protein